MAPLKLEFACMKDFGRITNNIKTMREHRQQVKVMAASDAIDMYIAGCPEHVRELLVQMRVAIREAAPGAEEVISYAMPAYKLNGMLVYFAAFKNHIGFYPTSSATSAFKDELAAYRSGKGSVQFPLDQPLPLELVARIVRFRVKENHAKAKAGANSKPR